MASGGVRGRTRSATIGAMFDETADPAAYAPPVAAQPRYWRTWSRAELYREGWTWRLLQAAVAGGSLHRARRDVYLEGGVDAHTLAACQVGGRLACVSELARWGVFVLDSRTLHVRVPAHGGRLRIGRRDVRVHWTDSPGDCRANDELLDAVTEAIVCQRPLEAVATLDSALHLGLLDEAGLAEVFARLPRRLHVLRGLIDPSSEAGSESIMRLVLRGLGCRVQTQVVIPGVGRVDLLVDGWLIVECDSEAHHGSWAQRRRDLRRDQTAASLGYVTYRPIAEDVFWHREGVVAAVRGLLDAVAHRTRTPVALGCLPPASIG